MNTNTLVYPMNVRRSKELGQVLCYCVLNGDYVFQAVCNLYGSGGYQYI